MRLDLLLCPQDGPGMGHIMRCMALADWGAERKAKVGVVVGLVGASMSWPCIMVNNDADISARVTVSDGDPWSDADWHIQDISNGGGYRVIRPHFGATGSNAAYTLAGETWMPLRRAFCGPQPTTARAGSVIYGASRTGCEQLLNMRPEVVAQKLGAAQVAIVPPSTIAYEAMAMGCPVRLLRGRSRECDEIGAAMVTAGVAVWDDDPRDAPTTNIIDGLGATRILDMIL